MSTSLERLTRGGLSIGIELPLDNDWSPSGNAKRQRDGRHPGVPDLAIHAELAELADSLGFRALWVRDVPLYDPSFGDAAQVFEVFSYLGFLASVTRNILLGTAAVVLPLREPLLTLKSAATIRALSGGRLLLGVASGDRPVEYPLFGRDFDSRVRISARRSRCCATARAVICRPASRCCLRRAHRFRSLSPVSHSKRRNGSGPTWTVASPIPARRPIISGAPPHGGRSRVTSPTSPSSISTSPTIRTSRCNGIASARARADSH